MNVKQPLHLPGKVDERPIVCTVVDPTRVLLIALTAHQTYLAQYPHVMRDQAQRQSEPLGDLTVALYALHQHVKDGQAHRMAQCL